MENKKSTLNALKVVFIVVGAVVTIGSLAIVAYKLFKKYFKVTFECEGEDCCDDCFCEDEAIEPICCCEGEDECACDCKCEEECTCGCECDCSEEA